MRPLFVLMGVATSMVAWFIVRMWGSGTYEVWRASCLLGAWAPLVSAAAFLYIQRVGDREHGVAAAWLVRAIGMHFVLAWLLGVSDWLRGPPGSVTMRNVDLVAPLALAAFFPVFGVGFTAFRWLLSVRRRLASRAVPTRVVERDAVPVPYRGAGPLRATVEARRSPVAAVVSALLGAGAVALASSVPWSTPWVLGVSGVALGFVAPLGAQAMAPSVVSLVCVAATLVSRRALSLGHIPSAGVWPWVALAGVGVYLCAIEARLRFAARGQSMRPATVMPSPAESAP